MNKSLKLFLIYISTVISYIFSYLGYFYPNLNLITFFIFLLMWIVYIGIAFPFCKRFHQKIVSSDPEWWIRPLRILFAVYISSVASLNLNGLLIVFPSQNIFSSISPVILGFQIFLSLCLAFSPFVNIFTKRSININSNITSQLNGD